MTASVRDPRARATRFAAPELRGAAFALGACQDHEVCLDGPAGTGKTVGCLYKIHRLLSAYAGSRALVARKTNTALSGSAMVTYRDMIRRGRPDIRYFGGNKIEPAAFRYPNGSEMLVSGLDRPEKVQSAEFDWAYINEATECDLPDLEFVRMRLRARAGGPAVPYRQVLMDTNPGPPTHWLNERMNAGRTTRLLSRHEDNPRYYDLVKGDWTEEGREYIFGVLAGLTGVRYARYVRGIWAAAENTVYEDAFDRARNVVPRFAIPGEWPRYLAVDFGYTNPFVCKWYAQDPDGRLYCYREIYQTKTLVEEHAREVVKLSQWGKLEGGEPYPRAVLADHDAEGRATFERHTGLVTTAAHKAVSEGIQAVAARLRPAGDGRPRLLYFADALVKRDQELVTSRRPTCTIDEFESYVWDVRVAGNGREQPVKKDDHGMDADRYLCAYLDLGGGEVSYYPSVWK